MMGSQGGVDAVGAQFGAMSMSGPPGVGGGGPGGAPYGVQAPPAAPAYPGLGTFFKVYVGLIGQIIYP